MSEEKSIREELEAAMAGDQEQSSEVSEAEEVQAEAAVEAAEVAEAAKPAEPEAPESERARDERGRFAKKPEESTAPAETAEKPPEATEPTESTDQSAPQNWPEAAKAKWADIPAEVRETVLKRERDIAQFTGKVDEERRLGIDMQKTLNPYMPLIQAEGGDAVSAVSELLNSAYILRRGTQEQKQQLLLQTAQQFGIDIAQPQPVDVPAGMEPLYQEINQLKSQLSQQQQTLQQRELEQQTHLRSEVQQELEAFAADPEHPHYEDVRGRMAALISSGQAKDLQDAYDQACWASPEIRTTLQARENAEAEAKRKAEAAERAKSAKRKSISLDGGTSGSPAAPAPEDMSRRQQIEALFAANSGAV